jgi:hypothetical protein
MNCQQFLNNKYKRNANWACISLQFNYLKGYGGRELWATKRVKNILLDEEEEDNTIEKLEILPHKVYVL